MESTLDAAVATVARSPIGAAVAIAIIVEIVMSEQMRDPTRFAKTTKSAPLTRRGRAPKRVGADEMVIAVTVTMNANVTET